jgi:inorganic pyrophosphatase
MRLRSSISASSLAAILAISIQGPPDILSAVATTKLRDSLQAAAAHKSHLWRDTPAFDGTLVNAYIEIPFGERNKYEFNMATNTRVVDRVIPEAIGGYPVNYGIVPQTIGWDGDPFDALVLGPPLKGGALVKGIIVGIMHMEDEKGLDSKVVLSRVGADGRPAHDLTEADLERIADYFNRYKREDNDPKTYATVTGWGTAADGRAFVRTTHAFFKDCQARAGAACHVMP